MGEMNGEEMRESSSVRGGSDDQQSTPLTATRLPEELMSSVLVFLRMKDLLEWRIVANSTKAM